MILRRLLFLQALFGMFCLVHTASAQEELKLGDRKIIGGIPTTIAEHPWQIAMIVDREDGSFLCSGSIIRQNWVLTAAHCFGKNPSTAKARIKVNVNNYNTEGSWKYAESIVTNEAYNEKTHEHDIALVKGSFLSAGRIVPLASQETALSELIVSGWGDTEKGVPSKTLLKAYVPYVTNSTCNRPESYNGKIRDGMLCAGEKGSDSCQGDSGGPLVKGDTPATAFLVGVVSFGYGCGEQFKYGVYTRVSSEREWIARTIAANEKTKSTGGGK